MPMRKAAETDEQGRFSFAGLDPGKGEAPQQGEQEFRITRSVNGCGHQAVLRGASRMDRAAPWSRPPDAALGCCGNSALPDA